MLKLKTRGAKHSALWRSSLLICLVFCSGLLASCDLTGSQTSSSTYKNTFTSSSNRSISYSTNAQDVLIRTFYGGGHYGTLSLAPQISIYGDGTYILGIDQQGKLETDGLQHLLSTLIDTYGLLDFKRQQFSDLQDQNATYLELTVNGKQTEFVYGHFSNPQAIQQDQDEYTRLGKALTAITEALTGPTHPYTSTNVVLLARQIYYRADTQTIPTWTLSDFTLAAAAYLECGAIPKDETGPNFEIACLKYTLPQQVILLTQKQLRSVLSEVNGQGIFQEDGLYYSVTLRPLLPDELPLKTVAMFGSAQLSYKGVTLHEGAVPPPPQ